MKLGTRLALLGTGSALVAVAILSAIAVRLNDTYSTLVREKTDELFLRDLDHIVTGAYEVVRAEGDSAERELDRSLDVARNLLQMAGGIRISGQEMEWDAVDQYSGRQHRAALPRLTVGERPLVPNYDFGVRSLYVDAASELLGLTVTVFQRMDDEGDMLRAATTVPRADGRRATGTYLPRRMPDGSENPVLARVLAGERFRGRAIVVDDWYLTAYEPIRSPSGGIVGMLYVGRRQSEVEALIRSAIIKTKIGDSGYVYVVSGKGERRGRYVISKDGLRDGESIWDTRDSDGSYPARELIDAALRAGPGEVAAVRYKWRNSGEEEEREKIVRVVYYAPWDWVIGAGAYEDEWKAWRAPLSEAIGQFSVLLIGAATIIVLGAGAASALIARSLARPLAALAESARSYSDGFPWRSAGPGKIEEIAVLSDSLEGMAARIRDSVETLRHSEERYRGFFENAVEGIFITRMDGSVVDINPSMARMVGFASREEGLATVRDVAAEIYADREDRKLMLADLAARGISSGREFRFRRQDGSLFWVSMSVWVVRENDGSGAGLAGLVTDIEERKRTEEALRATLRQKESLIREVHHRVKNNLQILISILGIENRFVSGLDPVAVLADFADRVRAMARIHGLVYESADLDSADMNEYARIVGSELRVTHLGECGDAEFSVEGDAVILAMDQAIPCGLLINEILSNSFRHAFPPGTRNQGRIVASFWNLDGGMIEILLSDDGVGLPDAVGPKAEGRLGMMLIPALAGQIGAELTVDRTGGNIVPAALQCDRLLKVFALKILFDVGAMHGLCRIILSASRFLQNSVSFARTSRSFIVC